MNDLSNTIAHILEYKQYLAEANEGTTQQYVILPILRALGWDDTNLASMEILPEHAVKGGNVDYALKVGKKLALFIECKRWNEPLERHEDQIINYAFKAGVRIAGLTNGKIWRFYFSWVEGRSVSERIFCEIDVEDRGNAISNLGKYLLKSNVASGKAEEDAERALEKKQETDSSISTPIRPKTSLANDVIDSEPMKPETTIADEWTMDRVRDSLPEKVRKYHEANFSSEDKRNIFYRKVAETQNLIQAKGWILDVNFTTRYCGFKNKKRLVFGVRNTFSPPRFFAKITEEEAGSFSNQYECRYDSGRQSAFYTIPENVSELLPVLEFAYKKHIDN